MDYSTQITQMNQEESIYGFIKNTIATQITSADANALQKYVDIHTNFAGAGPVSALTDPTNLNRIVLQTINTNQCEPIKANVIQNTVERRLEIRVTYTTNGISKILDEYGNTMTLTEENGIIYTDTGTHTLGIGTYKYTVIDNKGNKKELSITPTINSLFKVAYINGTDNMDNTKAYTKSQETVSSTENTLLNQIKVQDTEKTYNRAIKDNNGLTTAIAQVGRTSEDEPMTIFGRYNVTYKYSLNIPDSYSTINLYNYGKAYQKYTITGANSYTLSEVVDTSYGWKYLDTLPSSTFYDSYTSENPKNVKNKSYIYMIQNYGATDSSYRRFKYNYKICYIEKDAGSRGTFIDNIIDREDAYTVNAATGSYWYESSGEAPKYTLYKYDQNLALKSTYDVDTKTLTTESIDISNKDIAKLKLNLSGWGSDYKVYISNNKADWQEVTDITIGTPKELNVDGWNDLYIKIENNSSTITNIDVAYYKD